VLARKNHQKSKNRIFHHQKSFVLWKIKAKKGPISSIYLVKLLFRVITYAKIEFRAEKALHISANLGNIFGEA